MSGIQHKFPEEKTPRLEDFIPIMGNHYAYGDLSDIERMLLVTDGTFTHLLEVLVGGRVEVDILKTEPVSASVDVKTLFGRDDLKSIWYREVLLVEAKDRTPYVFAQSYIDPQAFSQETQDEMLNSPDGLGRIFNELGRISERELLGFWLETQAAHHRFFALDKSQQSLCRTYRVVLDDMCVAVITEKMPRK